MKPLLVATSNQGKLKEFKDLLSDIFILQALDGSLPPPKEDGKTYFENAEKKARAYFDHYQLPVLTDDFSPVHRYVTSHQ